MENRLMKMILAFALLIILAKNIFGQGLLYNEEFQINTSTNHYQGTPSVVGLENGGFVVCWGSDHKTNYVGRIYAQLYDQNMNKLGTEFQVDSDNNETYTHWGGVVGSLTNGGFVSCWVGVLLDSSGYGIQGQLFNEDGAKIGAPLQINTFVEGDQWSPSVCGLGNGGFVVCWMSDDQDGNSYGIFAQRFNENGLKLGAEFQVNSYSFYEQKNPKVSKLVSGGFVITWESYGQDGDGNGIYARIYDQNGLEIGNEFLVNTNIISNQLRPSISNLKNGGFIVCWESMVYDSFGNDLYAQVFNENGLRIGNEFKVNITPVYLLNAPVVCELSTGGFLISWDEWTNSVEIKAQIFSENRTPIGRIFQINTYEDFRQASPSVARINNESFVICWQSYFQDGDDEGVFGKYYLSEPIYHNLNTFELVEPNNASSTVLDKIQFQWDPASDDKINFNWELTYDLYIDTNIGFSNPIIQHGIQDSTFQIDSLASGQTYYWKVLAKNYYGDSLWSSTVNSFTIDTTAVVGINIINPEIPKNFNLFQNYPNPFNPTTKIKFAIATSPLNPSPYQGEGNRERFITLKVYDILGNEIVTLVKEQKSPGTYEVEFNSEGLTSGIYFYKLNAGSFSQTKKMLLMK